MTSCLMNAREKLPQTLRSLQASVIASALAVCPAFAQTAAYEDLPDWSGVWSMTSNTVFDQATVDPPGGNSNSPGTREHPPYNEEWEAKYVANRARADRGQYPDPISICGTPIGYPRLFNLPGAYEFVVRPEETWVLTEDGPNTMRIYTDGRNHPPPDERWPTYSGESVGHWDGDTLAFETISLKGDGYTIVDRTGVVLSEQVRIQTQMQLVEEDLIEIRFTIDDPEAFVDTWHVVKQFRRMEAGTRMIEFACAENNRNPIDASGRTLTLDAEGNIIDQL